MKFVFYVLFIVALCGFAHAADTDVHHQPLRQEITALSAEQKAVPPIGRRVVLPDEKVMTQALGVAGSPFLNDVLASPEDSPWDGKLYLPGGWCSARAWDEDFWYIVTACHCVYNLSSPDSAVFETHDGTQYSATDVWVTQTCVNDIQNIPTKQDGAILKIMKIAGTGPAATKPARPGRRPVPCFFRRCVPTAEVDPKWAAQFFSGPGNELITMTGFPSTVNNGNKKYTITSLPTGDFDATTYLFGGNAGPGMSGAAVLCNAGNPPPGQTDPANVLCGILTLFTTDSSGTIWQNGAAYLTDNSGDWFQRLLDTAGVE